jgi:hypothetical protein
MTFFFISILLPVNAPNKELVTALSAIRVADANDSAKRGKRASAQVNEPFHSNIIGRWLSKSPGAFSFAIVSGLETGPVLAAGHDAD